MNSFLIFMPLALMIIYISADSTSSTVNPTEKNTAPPKADSTSSTVNPTEKNTAPPKADSTSSTVNPTEKNTTPPKADSTSSTVNPTEKNTAPPKNPSELRQLLSEFNKKFPSAVTSITEISLSYAALAEKMNSCHSQTTCDKTALLMTVVDIIERNWIISELIVQEVNVAGDQIFRLQMEVSKGLNNPKVSPTMKAMFNLVTSSINLSKSLAKSETNMASGFSNLKPIRKSVMDAWDVANQLLELGLPKK